MQLLFADHLTTWTAIGAVLQGIAAIVAFSAFFYSIVSYGQSLKLAHYTELDKMYFELLKVAVEHPQLLDPGVVRDSREDKQYNAYAFMMWNFIETIYDRCRGDQRLCDTWYPVLDAESSLHRNWFDDPANRPKFKQPFIVFIQGRFSQK